METPYIDLNVPNEDSTREWVLRALPDVKSFKTSKHFVKAS